jgi:hypothetical protein
MRMTYTINYNIAFTIFGHKSYQLEEEHIDELQKWEGLSSG